MLYDAPLCCLQHAVHPIHGKFCACHSSGWLHLLASMTCEQVRAPRRGAARAQRAGRAGRCLSAACCLCVRPGRGRSSCSRLQLRQRLLPTQARAGRRQGVSALSLDLCAACIVKTCSPLSLERLLNSCVHCCHRPHVLLQWGAPLSSLTSACAAAPHVLRAVAPASGLTPAQQQQLYWQVALHSQLLLQLHALTARDPDPGAQKLAETSWGQLQALDAERKAVGERRVAAGLPYLSAQSLGLTGQAIPGPPALPSPPPPPPAAGTVDTAAVDNAVGDAAAAAANTAGDANARIAQAVQDAAAAVAAEGGGVGAVQVARAPDGAGGWCPGELTNIR